MQTCAAALQCFAVQLPVYGERAPTLQISSAQAEPTAIAQQSTAVQAVFNPAKHMPGCHVWSLIAPSRDISVCFLAAFFGVLFGVGHLRPCSHMGQRFGL
jgi:hypothetical protein